MQPSNWECLDWNRMRYRGKSSWGWCPGLIHSCLRWQIDFQEAVRADEAAEARLMCRSRTEIDWENTTGTPYCGRLIEDSSLRSASDHSMRVRRCTLHVRSSCLKIHASLKDFIRVDKSHATANALLEIHFLPQHAQGDLAWFDDDIEILNKRESESHWYGRT